MSQKPSDIFTEEHLGGYKILENFLTKFLEEIDYHAKAKILYSLVKSYVEHFTDELETNEKASDFNDVLHQIPGLCENFLQTSVSFSLNEEPDTFNLENKSKNLESASLCFDALLICLEAFHTTNQCVVVIKVSLKVLSQGYNHCKESEIIYGNLLEQFADQLGHFFKKIESLQTVILEQVNNLVVTQYADDDRNVNDVAIEMGNLCEIVFSLDADIAFELWSKYLRLITDLKSLKPISNINVLSTYLSTKNIEVLQLVKFSSGKSSEEDEELSAKLFFYLDALSNVVDLVPDCFKENVSQFRTFLINLLDCLISCYSPFAVDNTSQNIIKSSLVKNTFPLLSHLYADEDFLKSVIVTEPDRKLHLSIILLKLCSLQFMENASLELKENFLKDLFSDFLSNTVEDDLKIVHSAIPQCTVTEINTEKSVTLYKLAYEQMTKFLKLMPDFSIRELENTVLKCLASSSDITYLLISDVWMYRLRCTSIEFLKDRCHSVLQNLQLENVNNNNIMNFVKRMLKFLPCSYKERLLEQFNSLRFIQDRKRMQHRFGTPDLASTENDTDIISEEKIQRLMVQLQENTANDAVLLVKKACTCIELCTLFVHIAGDKEILLFLEFASEMFKTGVYEIQIVTLTFVKSLSRKKLAEEKQEFGKIVTCMAQLFSEAIHSKNYIVKYEARNIFSHFAKCTPHIKIVQETVKRDPSLKPVMKSYMNAVPDNNFLSEKEKIASLQKQMSLTKNVDFEIPSKIQESLKQMFSRGDFSLLS